MKLLVLRFQGSSWSLSGGLWHQLDLAAEVIDSSNQAQDHLFAVTMREMGGAEVLVLDTVFQHVVSGREHGGGDGEDGFFGAASGAQAVELGLQVGLLGAHRGPGRADQGGFKPWRPLAHAGGAAFTGAFVVARTQAGPRSAGEHRRQSASYPHRSPPR